MRVGDYVRTKSGIIGKIESKNYIGYSDWLIDTLYYNDDGIIDDWTCGVKEYDVLKSSPNIIDLLEVGDYVNGYKVNAEYAPYGVYIEIPFVDSESIGCNVDLIRTEEIESIVTREMFESIEYKVGE
jgi:hypothetical protein